MRFKYEGISVNFRVNETDELSDFVEFYGFFKGAEDEPLHFLSPVWIADFLALGR